MPNTFSEDTSANANGLQITINNPTDNINLMFDFVIDPTLDLKDIADSLETLILNSNNPKKNEQLQRDLAVVFGLNRIENIFTIENKQNNKWFILNRTIYLNFGSENIEIDLNKYKFLDNLIMHLKSINYDSGNTLFDISYHENYDQYKYYKTSNLEFNSNLQVEVDIVPDTLAFELPRDLFITDIIFPEFYNKIKVSATDINDYKLTASDETSNKYFLDTVSEILYLPIVMLNTPMSLVAVKRDFNFNWCNLKIYHMAHPTSKRIVRSKESNYYELSSKGISIYNLVNELHSEVWGK
jgi:hypothetical protein